MKRSLFCLLSVLVAIFVQTVCAHSTIAQDSPQYELTLFGNGQQTTLAYNMNNAGTVVGKFTDADGSENAFVWRPETGLVNLNNIAVTPPGWRLGSARGINESGQISGNATNQSTGQIVAYRFDAVTNVVELMQTFSTENHPVGHSDPINEFGDVLYFSLVKDNNGYPVGSNVYVDEISGDLYSATTDIGGKANGINNFRQVVGWGYRLTFGDTPEDPHQLERFEDSDGIKDILQINDDGYFGSYIAQKKRGRSVFKAIRYTNSVEIISSDAAAFGINNTTPTSSGDVIGRFESTQRGFLFTDELGIVNLDDAVVGTVGDLGLWFSSQFISTSTITDRNSSGHGQICGAISSPEGVYRAFVLTPIIPGQTPGISVTPTTGLTTTESGGTATFNVVLATEPTANVTIGISTSIASEGMLEDPVNPSGPLLESYDLVFDSTNWNQPQTVIVVGIDDEDIDPNTAYTIETAAAGSTDPDYNGIDPDDVEVTNLDDEQAPTVTYSVLDDPNWQPLAIPDFPRAGIESTIPVADDFQIANMVVTLNISHQRSSDLSVYLVGANDQVVQLFNFNGDNNVADFNGSFTNGPWTLQVFDNRKKRTGDLNSWAMTVETN